jgi:hypothetical protein
MPGDKWDLGPFGWVALALSVLLNVSGMASIVDGFVVWGGFIRDFVDIYQTWIREPIHGALQFVWPLGRLPRWVADWFCINGSVAAAYNLALVYHGEKTVLGGIIDIRKLYLERLRALGPLLFLFAPLFVLIAIFGLIAAAMFGLLYLWIRVIVELAFRGRIPSMMLSVFLCWLGLVGTLIVLMFLNWQMLRAGVW